MITYLDNSDFESELLFFCKRKVIMMPFLCNILHYIPETFIYNLPLCCRISLAVGTKDQGKGLLLYLPCLPHLILLLLSGK
ncbi:unnamed protein product [Arabidopsis halleri]